MASARDLAIPRAVTRTNSQVTTKRWTKSFTFKVAARLIGICFLGCLTGFLLFDSPYWMAAIWAALGTGALFYETVRFVNLSERKLTAFLQSIKQNDFTVTFSEDKKSDDYQLHLAFNQLNETFKSLRADKESQHQLLQIVVAHAAVPLVCFDEVNEEVYLINDAAKELFRVPILQKIDALRRVDPGLPEFLRNIRDGGKSSLKLVLGGKPVFLSVTSRHLLFMEKNLKLIALTDVSSELAARDADAWQKLLRVLTHEISNSAIPLSTLSSYAFEMVSHAEVSDRPLSSDERRDVLESLRTIDQRSQSLKSFVGNFKNVNKIPEPKVESFALKSLVHELNVLFAPELDKEEVELVIEVKEDVRIMADKSLTMQVLINLMKNAIEAMENMKHGKRIAISAERIGALMVNLHLADSGCGIPPEEMDQIFIPFYSTKKNGSGIGLSIARQIMQKQGGDLIASSTPGKGSVFTASFAQ